MGYDKIFIIVFHSFIFIVENDEMRDELFKDPYIQKHSKVSAIRKLHGSADRFIGFTYNFFKPGEHVQRFIWRKETPITNTEQVFTSMDDFQDFEFHVGVLPWSHHVLGDKVAAPEGSPATYENYWGYEIELLRSIAKILNFRYRFSNVEDGKWGHIEADTTWSGMVAQVNNTTTQAFICQSLCRQHGGMWTLLFVTCSSHISGLLILVRIVLDICIQAAGD